MTQDIDYKVLCEQQAAVIEQMREALQVAASSPGRRYMMYETRAIIDNAIELQPCPEVLNKVKRDAIIENAEAWKEYAQRLEKGE